VSVVHARSNGGDGCGQGIGVEAVRASIIARILELSEWSNRIGDKGRRRDLLYRRELTERGRRGIGFNAYEALSQLSSAQVLNDSVDDKRANESMLHCQFGNCYLRAGIPTIAHVGNAIITKNS
jgi:hypothetical protein